MSCGPPHYRCPACRVPSGMVIGDTQAICTNDEGCNVVTFNPSLPDGGLSKAQGIDLSALETQDE